MKLLMITGLGSAKDLASGKKGAFYNTLEEFHKHWDRIDIMAPKIKGHKGTIELFGNVFIHISPWPLLLHPIWFLRKGIRIYKEHKFDLMTVQEFPPFYNGIGARLLWQKIKIPYVLEIHHISGYPRSANLKEKVYRLLTHLFIKWDSSKAKTIRVVNQKQVPEFLIKAGVPKEKITHIPSAYIDLEIFKPLDLEKKYDLIFVGRLEKNKGLDLLLEVARNLKNQMPDFKLLIVGDGKLKIYCKLKIENWKLQNNVFLHGYAQDSQEIARLLNKSRVLIMLSDNEGGPRVILEALACGVPVVATPVGVSPDVIVDGKNGYLTDWNIEDASDKVNKVITGGMDKNNCIASAGKFERSAMINNYAESLKALII